MDFLGVLVAGGDHCNLFSGLRILEFESVLEHNGVASSREHEPSLQQQDHPIQQRVHPFARQTLHQSRDGSSQ